MGWGLWGVAITQPKLLLMLLLLLLLLPLVMVLDAGVVWASG